MNLGSNISKLLNEQYLPNTTIEKAYKNLDLVFSTDETGTPVLLFLGKKDEPGKVKGDDMQDD